MKKPKVSEFPLLDRTDAIVDDLRLNIPKALCDSNSKAIHQSRVATRRLKATLDLLEPVLENGHAKPFVKVLRKLRRQLGPLRDLDVMIGHLAELKGGRDTGDAVAWVSDRLVAQRERARDEVAGAKRVARILGRLGAWWGVRQDLADTREAVESLLAESLHEQLDTFAQRAAWLAPAEPPDSSQPAEQTDAAPPQPAASAAEQPYDPHQLRIAGKHLRYTLEMAEAEGHNLPPNVMKSFRQMQESLGLWHDYVVLSERTLQLSLDELLPHHDAELQLRLLDLSKLLLKRANRHLNDFHDLWRERGPALSESIRQRFSLTRDVNAPKTDRDQPGSTEFPGPADVQQAVA